MNFRTGVAFLILAGILLGACSSSDPERPTRSFWDSITGVFSSRSDAKGSDEQEKKLAELDREIREMHWKYSRENRPQKKSRYKDYLERLRISRDSLASEIQKGSLSSPGETSLSSSGTISSPAAKTVVSSASESSASSSGTIPLQGSGEKLSSSSNASSGELLKVEPGTLPLRVDSVYVTTTITKIVRDTVYVRDTLVVRDTVFLPAAPGEN